MQQVSVKKQIADDSPRLFQKSRKTGFSSKEIFKLKPAKSRENEIDQHIYQKHSYTSEYQPDGDIAVFIIVYQFLNQFIHFTILYLTFSSIAKPVQNR